MALKQLIAAFESLRDKPQIAAKKHLIEAILDLLKPSAFNAIEELRLHKIREHIKTLIPWLAEQAINLGTVFENKTLGELYEMLHPSRQFAKEITRELRASPLLKMEEEKAPAKEDHTDAPIVPIQAAPPSPVSSLPMNASSLEVKQQAPKTPTPEPNFWAEFNSLHSAAPRPFFATSNYQQSRQRFKKKTNMPESSQALLHLDDDKEEENTGCLESCWNRVKSFCRSS